MLNELFIAFILSLCTTTLMYGLALFFKKRWRINHPKNTYLIYLIVLLTAASIFPFASLAFSTHSSQNISSELDLTDIETMSMSDTTIITKNQNVTYASSIAPLMQPMIKQQEGKELYLQKITWNELVILDDYTIKDKKVVTDEPISENPIDTSNLLQKHRIAINKNGMQTQTLLNQIVTNLFIQQEPIENPIQEGTVENTETPVKERDVSVPTLTVHEGEFFVYTLTVLLLISLFYVISCLFFTKKRILSRLQATCCTDPSILDLIKRLSKEFNISPPILYEYTGPPNAFVFGYPICLAFSTELKRYLSEKEFEAAIRHELAHIKNHDVLIKPLITGLRIFFFYNPIVHIVSYKILKNREILADMSTYTSKQERISLMEALIKINEYTNTATIPKGTLALLSYKPKKLTLSERFSNLFEKTTKKTVLTAIVALIVLLANASIFFAAGSIANQDDISEDDALYAQEFSIDESYYSQTVSYAKVQKNSEICLAMIIQRNMYNIISTTSSSLDVDNTNLSNLFSQELISRTDERPF